MHTPLANAFVAEAIKAARALKWAVIRAYRPLLNMLLEPQALAGVPNRPIVHALMKVGIWPDANGYDAETGWLSVPEWQAAVSHDCNGWHLKRGEFQISLDSEQAFLWAGALFGKRELPPTRRGQQSGDVKWLGQSNGFLFYMESVCDMNTARELFIEQEYQWFTEQFAPGCVVWDIGMNLGMASLLFAAQSDVRHVYAFEPMPRTFDVAREALAENPFLSGKITATNAGIADSERTDIFDYTAISKAGTGMVGILPTTLRHYDIRPGDIQKVEARLLDADVVLRRIRADYPDAPIYLKCDCEGAEYEIIDRLAETGALEELDTLIVECHKGDPGRIVAQLESAGFAAELTVKAENLFYHIQAVRRIGHAFGSDEPFLTLASTARRSVESAERTAA